MLLRMKGVIAAIIISAACGFSAQAAADEVSPGWYMGADFGHAELQLENLGNPNISNKDFSNTTFSIHGGYRFNPYFAIESTFADFGGYGYRVDFCAEVCAPEAFPAEISISGKRLDLALVGSIPLGERLEAYAKVGFVSTEIKYEGRSLNDTVSFSNSDSETIYGIGLRLHFDVPWSLRLQWDRTQLDDYEADVDAWWLGAEYRFGSR